MATHLLSLDGIRLTFGGDALLENAALTVAPRARLAVVGRNGSGKSTLLKIAAGLVEADGGERFLDPKCTVAYLEQEPDLDRYTTLGDYIAETTPETGDAGRVARFAADLDVDLTTSPARASGGERRRAALARTLLSAPDLLLLDEPTNHLDVGAIDWLERKIAGYRGAVVVISHDRRLLEATTTETLWIDRGRTIQIDKGFRDFEGWRDAFLEREQAEAHKLDRKIASEEDWVRYGVTARRKRNVRRMAELADFRRQRREARKATGSVAFSVSDAGASSKRVVKAEAISKAFGERVIVKDFSIEIARGDRIALVGPNGAGKTTLLRLLTGEMPPDDGRIEIGSSLNIASLDQNRLLLDPNATVADAITDGRGDWVRIAGENRHVASYLKDFLFDPAQFRSPVSALSGGERGRLALAAILAHPSNVLILDEPTNDLDLETLDLLEETLAAYAGTLILVSHDRSFIDKVATSVIAPAPDGRPGAWLEYVGGYSDMLAQRGSAPFRGMTGTAATAAASKAPPADAASTSRTARSAKAEKLSFKEKFALENLPKRMSALEQEIASLKATLATPALFKTDPATFNGKAQELATAEAALVAAEEQWLELEMKREALEA